MICDDRGAQAVWQSGGDNFPAERRDCVTS